MGWQKRRKILAPLNPVKCHFVYTFVLTKWNMTVWLKLVYLMQNFLFCTLSVSWTCMNRKWRFYILSKYLHVLLQYLTRILLLVNQIYLIFLPFRLSLWPHREGEIERNRVNRLVFPGLTVSSLAITSPVAWPSWAIFCLSIKTPLDEVREMLG